MHQTWSLWYVPSSFLLVYWKWFHNISDSWTDTSQVEEGTSTGEGDQDLFMDRITSSYLDPGLLFSVDGAFTGDSYPSNIGFEETLDNRFWAPL